MSEPTKKHPRQNGDDDDGMPHVFAVFTGPGSRLPDGLVRCAVCGENKMHREIRAWDADLEGFLCRHCFLPMSQAEYWLRQTAGLRMPSASEAAGMRQRSETDGTYRTDGTDNEERRAA